MNTWTLQHLNTSTLQHFNTLKLRHFYTSKIQNGKTSKFQNFKTPKLLITPWINTKTFKNLIFIIKVKKCLVLKISKNATLHFILSYRSWMSLICWGWGSSYEYLLKMAKKLINQFWGEKKIGRLIYVSLQPEYRIYTWIFKNMSALHKLVLGLGLDLT